MCYIKSLHILNGSAFFQPIFLSSILSYEINLRYQFIYSLYGTQCQPYSVLSHVQLFASCWTVALPGSSVHWISQARRLDWVAISSSRGSSWPRDWTCVSWVSCKGDFITEPPGKWNSILEINLLQVKKEDLSFFFFSSNFKISRLQYIDPII